MEVLMIIQSILDILSLKYLLNWFVVPVDFSQPARKKSEIAACITIVAFGAFGWSDLAVWVGACYLGVLLLLNRDQPGSWLNRIGRFLALLAWMLLPCLMLIYYFGLAGHGGESRETELGFTILLALLDLTAIWKGRSNTSHFTISGMDIFFTGIVSFFVFLLTFTMNPTMNNEAPLMTGPITPWLQQLVGLALLLLILFLYLTVWRNSVSKHYQQLDQQNRAYIQEQMTYFTIYKRSQEDIRRFRHDIHHHFAMLQQYAAGGDTQGMAAYLATVQQQWQKVAQQVIQTGDETLDAVLNLKNAQAKEAQAALTVTGALSKPLPLTPFDSTTIFANALDNAIEAAGGTVGGTIAFTIKSSGNFVVITITNPLSFDQPKKDRRFHGFGLGNIQKTLAKQGGWLEVDKEGGQFQLTLMIPQRPLDDK